MMREGTDICQLEISLGGYQMSLHDLIKLHEEGQLIFRIPERWEVELRFLSIPLARGIGVFDGDDLVITLDGEELLTEQGELKKGVEMEKSDKAKLFFELEEIYRKLSFRDADKSDE